MKRLILFWALSLFAFFAMAQEHCISGRYGQSTIFLPDEIQIHADVVYTQKNHWLTGQTVNLAMDVFFPDSDVDPIVQRPLVVLFHGGAFLGGARQAMHTECMEYAQRGYVAATVSYRLGWDCPPDAGLLLCALCGPQQSKLRRAMYAAVQDALDALNFLALSAETFGIDIYHTFLGGESAGALTALHAAFWTQDEANSFIADAESNIGPLLEGAIPGAFPGSVKGVINQCGAIVNVNHLSPEFIPVISFHDDGDCVVPYNSGNVLGCLGCTSFPVMQGSGAIYNYLKNQEVCTELNTSLLSLGHCQWPKLNLVRRAACFMKRTMCGVCTTSANIDNTAWSPCDMLGANGAVNCPECPADLNNDGVVSFADLTLMLAAFGSVCP